MTIADSIEDLKQGWIRETRKIQTEEFQEPIRESLRGVIPAFQSLQKSWQDEWKVTPSSQQVDMPGVQLQQKPGSTTKQTGTTT